MSTPPDPPSAARLELHAASLRQLAARLVRDAAEADDLVQQTWLRAVERPPHDRGRLGSWLRSVLRNEARQLRRRDAARMRRERGRATREAVPAAEDVVERSEQIERLIAAVRSLAEPYRTSMLLRWVDGLTPASIADRLGEPAGTVRSRLSRGMELLKQRLDHTHGTRRAWAIALVPAAAHALPGGMALKGSLKLAAVAIVLFLLGAGGWWAVGTLWPADDVGQGDGMSAAVYDSADARNVALVGRAEIDTSLPAITPGVDAVDGDAFAWIVRGRVLTTEARPVDGARVTVELAWPNERVVLGAATTAADGTYRIAIPTLADESTARRATAGLVVRAEMAGFTSEPAGEVARHTPQTKAELPVVVDLHLLPGPMLRGRVLDRDGEPVAGGRVVVHPLSTGRSRQIDVDAEGRYRLRVLKEGDVRVSYTHPGRGHGETPPFHVGVEKDVEAPDIRLFGAGRIEGTTRFADGSPAAHVSVLCTLVGDGDGASRANPPPRHGLRDSSTRSDEQGRFAFTTLAPGRYRVFHKRNPKPRLAPIHDIGARGVEVVVHGHRVRFRVRDERGRPVPDASYVLRHGFGQTIPEVSAGSLSHEDAAISFWGPPGSPVEIAVGAYKIPHATARAEVPGDRHEQVIDLVLKRPSVPPGRIRLRVHAPDQTLMRRARVQLLTRHAEAPIVYPGHSTTEEGVFEFDAVPVGAYTLRVYPGADSGGASRTHWFPVEGHVDVRSGQTSERTLEARAGGRLRLSVRGNPKRYTPTMYRLAFELWPDGAEAPVRLRRFVRLIEGGRWSEGSLRLGQTMTALDLFESGTYRLRVRRGERVLFETAVVILAGRTSEIDVRLPDGD